MRIVRPPVAIGQTIWDWSRTYLFGVLNVTPDSFSDGGRFQDVGAAVAHGLQLLEEGADVLDVGGESTRPGAVLVPAAEELRRVLPVVEALARRGAVVSIDTYKAEVAAAALDAGAAMINDISGLRLDPAMAPLAAERRVPLIIGHLRGTPQTMMDAVAFDDVVREVVEELRASVRLALEAGVEAAQIWIDPCLGFGKRAEHSLALIQQAKRLRRELGFPLLLGPSRKSFIGAVTGQPAGERVIGTAAACAVAITVGGVEALRVHDVGALRPAVQVADAIARAPGARA